MLSNLASAGGSLVLLLVDELAAHPALGRQFADRPGWRQSAFASNPALNQALRRTAFLDVSSLNFGGATSAAVFSPYPHAGQVEIARRAAQRFPIDGPCAGGMRGDSPDSA